MLRAGREQDRVVVRRGLQLEVERDAEPLAQREPPCAVDAHAERRMHDELHPAGVVEEALEHDVGVRRHDAESVSRRAHVIDHLLRAEFRERALGLQSLAERLPVVQPRADIPPQLPDFLRQLHGPPGRLAEPERDRRRRTLRVRHAHRRLLDALDAPRRRAEQEDVACLALHREVLVHRADGDVLRLGDDAVVAHLGDRPAVGDRGEARAAAAADDAVDAVAMDQRRRATGAVAQAVRQHLHDLVEVLARQRRERRGASREREEVVLAPVLARRLGDDLLREDVERRDRLLDAVEPPGAHRAHERRALDQLVA